MCYVGSIPYLQEGLIALVGLMIIWALFKKESCPCKEQIAALQAEIASLKSLLENPSSDRAP